MTGKPLVFPGKFPAWPQPLRNKPHSRRWFWANRSLGFILSFNSHKPKEISRKENMIDLLSAWRQDANTGGLPIRFEGPSPLTFLIYRGCPMFFPMVY
jgi:hypothetical protein